MAVRTSPNPDPSFFWATRPESLRVGYPQPRILHWWVTDTIGQWLVVFTVPFEQVGAIGSSHPGNTHS